MSYRYRIEIEKNDIEVSLVFTADPAASRLSPYNGGLHVHLVS